MEDVAVVAAPGKGASPGAAVVVEAVAEGRLVVAKTPRDLAPPGAAAPPAPLASTSVSASGRAAVSFSFSSGEPAAGRVVVVVVAVAAESPVAA